MENVLDIGTTFEAHADKVTVAAGELVDAYFILTMKRTRATGTRPKRRIAFVVDFTPPMFRWLDGALSCPTPPWTVAIDAVRRAAAMFHDGDRLSVTIVASGEATVLVETASAPAVQQTLRGPLSFPHGTSETHRAHHGERCVAVALEALSDTTPEEQPQVVFVGCGQHASDELDVAVHAEALPCRVLRSALVVNVGSRSGRDTNVDEFHAALVAPVGVSPDRLTRRGPTWELGGGRLGSLMREGRASWDDVLIATLFLDEGTVGCHRRAESVSF